MFLRRLFSTLCPTPGPTVGVLGAVMWRGQPRPGVEQGPASLRSAQLIPQLRQYAPRIRDLGDHVAEDVGGDGGRGRLKHPLTVGKSNRDLCERVARHLQDHDMMVTLGGDHSVAIGTVLGHCKAGGKPPAVIWVDAHADINTPRTTPSGNFHGTPVSFLLKEYETETRAVEGFDWIRPCLGAGDLAFIGLRDVDPPEKEIIEKLGLSAYYMEDVQEYGIDEVLRRCLERLDPNNSRSLHLSFDIDGLDPTLAPATGTPVTDGLSKSQGEYICESLFQTGRLRGVDLVEVNPSLSDRQGVKATISSAIAILEHCVGRTSHL